MQGRETGGYQPPRDEGKGGLETAVIGNRMGRGKWTVERTGSGRFTGKEGDEFHKAEKDIYPLANKTFDTMFILEDALKKSEFILQGDVREINAEELLNAPEPFSSTINVTVEGQPYQITYFSNREVAITKRPLLPKRPK